MSAPPGVGSWCGIPESVSQHALWTGAWRVAASSSVTVLSPRYHASSVRPSNVVRVSGPLPGSAARRYAGQRPGGEGERRHSRGPRPPEGRRAVDDDGPSRHALGLETIMRSGGEHGPNETENSGRVLGRAPRAFRPPS
jgi:hypothetical protein